MIETMGVVCKITKSKRMNTNTDELALKRIKFRAWALQGFASILLLIGGYRLGLKHGKEEGREWLVSQILNHHGSSVSFCKEVLYREGKGKPDLTADEHMERWRSLARWSSLDYVILETYLFEKGRDELVSGNVHGSISKLISIANRENETAPYQAKMNHPLNLKKWPDQKLLDDFVIRHPLIE
jgi:hypothetical protein